MNSEKNFSDKIDWKFYNFLIATLEDYKVAGLIPIVSVSTKSTNNSYEKVFESGHGYIDTTDIEVLNYWYNKSGLFYRISIVGEIDDTLSKEIFSKIKSKSIKIRDKYKTILTVKPIKFS